MSEYEQKKRDLEIAKLEADIRGAKLDRIIRPFQILIPIILALGLYLLVQQPQVKEKESSTCIDQIKFVTEFSKDKKRSEDTLRSIFQSISFRCEAAQITADGILAKRSTEERLVEVDKIGKIGSEYFELNFNSITDHATLCTLNEVAPITPLYASAFQALENLKVSTSRLEKSQAATATALKLEQHTGCGPKCTQLIFEHNNFLAKLSAAKNQIAKREEQLAKLRSLVEIERTVCPQ